ncbi:MotE family protein [Acuticoccus sp. M5D2P5]|uniref:MotE family protein n=1 Tax=Acuticoccus kalidii TaxID=2910977 RepID=UPI001F31828C|nr:MotE family protein [Acuticoccus kalidii]MCF3932468.1 MotE family protein [Acuticoccus kalidii]
MTDRSETFDTWRTSALRPLREGALIALALLGVTSVVPPAAAQSADDTAFAYCTNLADEAADARFARKLAALEAAEAKVADRLAALETKRAEYEDWLARRERFLRLAEDSLVSIYSAMRPDAASAQLAEMNELTAAAVIAKVTPRTASAILNEMEPKKAARIASIMAGLSRVEPQRSAG